MAESLMVNRITQSNSWLLNMVLPGRWGRWLTGALIFSALFCLFVFIGGILDETSANRISPTTVGFFCFILAYIIPIHHLIVERSLHALDQLQKAFPDKLDSIGHVEQLITHKSRWWFAATLGVGLISGTAHNSVLIVGSDSADIFTRPSALLTFTVTTAIWIVMTSVIWSLVQNATLFNRLGGQINIPLLNVRAATPFGSVAVSSTLAMIGAQAVFPALMIDSDSHWVTFVPGLIATGVPMIFLFLLPILPVHRQILSAKNVALDRVNSDIAALSSAQAGGDTALYPALQPLLVYRREILSAPEWPFDTSVMGRLALYLFIPPLTWVGAALIEILIDTAL